MDHNPLHTVASGRNLGPVFLGIDWAVFSVSTIVVLIRLYTRLAITRNFGWDDATIALTQCITAIGKGFVVAEVSYGLGQHKYDLSVEQYRNFLKYNYLDVAQFFIALALCKISICLFLLRLSQFHKLKDVLYGLIAFLVITHISLFLLVVLQCKPVHKAWDQGVPGICFSKDVVMNITIVQGVFSFTTDFICAAFPVVLIRRLNIRRQSKIALYFLMGLGAITGAVAIARTATAPQIKSSDLSWVGIPNAITRIFEVNVGNVAACVPILKPFYRYMRARVTGHDPYQMLHRNALNPTSPAHWYSGRFQFWQRKRRSSSVYSDTKQNPKFPAGVTRAPSAIGRDVETSHATETTLGLPLQGVRIAHFSEESLPNFDGFEPGGQERERYSGAQDAKGIV